MTERSSATSRSPEPIPFWKWKAEQIEKDKFTRSREWYFRAYGGYCNAVRKHGR